MAIKGSAGILAVLDGFSILRFDEGPVRSAYAAHAFADEGPVADPLMSGVGRDANGFEGVGPALACPHRTGDGHVTFDGLHFIPAVDSTMCIDHQLAKLAHAHYPLLPNFVAS